jgi:hypothetical protein
MLEDKSYHKVNSGSERNFGIVFFIFFLIISFYPLLSGNNFHLWSFILAFLFLFFAFFFPKILTIPNIVWFRIGIILGNIVSPITMGVIFYLTVTPTGLFMRMLGKDILNQKIKKNKKSYWVERKQIVSSYKNQY